MLSPQPNDNPTDRRRLSGAWSPLFASPLFALLGVLAVLLGVQASRLETGRTLTASAHSAPLPEFRVATPLPGPSPDAPPDPKASPVPSWTWQSHLHASPRVETAPVRRPSLALYGRRQAEGG